MQRYTLQGISEPDRRGKWVRYADAHAAEQRAEIAESHLTAAQDEGHTWRLRAEEAEQQRDFAYAVIADHAKDGGYNTNEWSCGAKVRVRVADATEGVLTDG